jgi:hypothetical protein
MQLRFPKPKVIIVLGDMSEIKKTMDEATAAKIKAENEEIRKVQSHPINLQLRDKAIEEICMKFSCFKRDFMGAPIRKAL